MRNNFENEFCCPKIKTCKSVKKSRLPSKISCEDSKRSSIRSMPRPCGPRIIEETPWCKPEPAYQPCQPPQEEFAPPCCLPPCCVRRRYIQPKVRESFRPVRKYIPPVLPMPCATVYNNSFECVDAKTAALCRLAPANPKNSLAIPLTAQFTKETVTKMSFPAPCPTDKTLPIRPNAKSMLTQGLEHQMQSLTTQKHDFVPKCQGRRQKMVPVDKIKKRCGDVEHETTQKLSFMIPDTCHYTKAQSCKPQRFYKPPVLPFASETTQKMSFMPVRPLTKEIHPWAQKKKYMRPALKFAKDTVNKMSYMLPGTFVDEVCNCGCAQESSPSIPVDCYPKAGF